MRNERNWYTCAVVLRFTVWWVTRIKRANMHTVELESTAISRFNNVRTRTNAEHNCASSPPLPREVLKINWAISMQCTQGSGVTVTTPLGWRRRVRHLRTSKAVQGFKNTGNTERVKRPNTIWAGLWLTSWRGVLRISSKTKYWSELSSEVRLSIFLTLFTTPSALPLADWCPGDKVLWMMRYDCINSVKSVHRNCFTLSECKQRGMP